MKEKKKKVLIFCSKGLGDGLLFLILAHNLYINGYQVIVFHDFLDELQSWFKEVKFIKFPQNLNQIKEMMLSSYMIIMNYDDRQICKDIERFIKVNFSGQFFILIPTTCKAKTFLGDFRFDVKKSMVKNLYVFCQKHLFFHQIEKSNGIEPPSDFHYRKQEKRVVFHATASSQNHIWPIKKTLKLAKKIKARGFEPFFCFSYKEEHLIKAILLEGFQAIAAKNLSETAKILYESGFFVGNDSGLGHLASCLKIPTLTISSSKRNKLLWRPDWFTNITVIPYGVIPNMKFLRLRQHLWKYFLEIWRVFYHFKKLIKEGKK